jgi:hypothetical protein
MNLGVNALLSVLHRLRIRTGLNVVALASLHLRVIEAIHPLMQCCALRLRH